MQVQNNETLKINGTLDLSSASITWKTGSIARSVLSQETLVSKAIPLTDFRVFDAVSSLLPATAASDDLAIITGTHGTDAPVLQTSDGKATTVTQKARVLIPIDESYDTGETIILRIRGGMNTTVSDTTATVDLSVYVPDEDGAVGSDICATAAQSINSLTAADKDFTITPGSLAIGNILDCLITVAITDSATGTAVIGEITSVKLLRDVKG